MVPVNKHAISAAIEHLKISPILIDGLSLHSLSLRSLWYDISLTDPAQKANHLSFSAFLSAESFLPGT